MYVAASAPASSPLPSVPDGPAVQQRQVYYLERMTTCCTQGLKVGGWGPLPSVPDGVPAGDKPSAAGEVVPKRARMKGS